MTAPTVLGPRLVLPAGASREEWLAERRHGLGGTDVAALFGVDKYRTQLHVYLDKTTDREDENPAEFEENADARYWGTVLEPVVADHFQRRNGLILSRSGMWARDGWKLANPDRFVATPDQVVNDNRLNAVPDMPHGIYEGKTASAFLDREWAEGRVPDKYVVQVQWYLHVLDLRQAHIAALIGGQRYVQAEIERDDELIDGLVTVAAQFWQRVLDRRPPALQGEPVEAALDLLKAMHPVSVEGKQLDLPESFAGLLRDWEKAKTAAKYHQERADALQVEIREALGDAQLGLIGGQPAIRATNVAGSTSVVTRKPHRRLYVQKGFKP